MKGLSRKLGCRGYIAGLSIAVLMATQSAAAPTTTSQAQLLSMFETICLRSYPNTAKMQTLAVKAGLKQVNGSQWSNADTSVNVFVFTPGEKPESAQIKSSLFKDVAWKFKIIPVDAHAKLKRGEVGCAIATFATPVSGLVPNLAQVVARFGNVDLKSARSGAVGRGTGQVNGVKVRINSKALSDGPQVRFGFISAVGGK